MEFGEFTITLDNFLDVFFKPFAKLKKKTVVASTVRVLDNKIAKLGDQIYKIKTSQPFNRKYNFKLEEIAQIDSESLSAMAPFEIHYSEESFAASAKAKWLFGTGRLFNDVAEALESQDKARIFAALEATPGYRKRRQFEFTRNQAESIAGFETIATLPLGEEAIKKAWLNYAELLNETIRPVYEVMGLFDQNITDYFTDTISDEEKKKGVTRKAKAVEAGRRADELKTVTSVAVEKVHYDEPA